MNSDRHIQFIVFHILNNRSHHTLFRSGIICPLVTKAHLIHPQAVSSSKYRPLKSSFLMSLDVLMAQGKFV